MLAVIAVVLACISLLWQVYMYLQGRRLVAYVDLRQTYSSDPAVDDYTGELLEGVPPIERYELEVIVINRSATTIVLDKVGVGHPVGQPVLWVLDAEGIRLGPGEDLRRTIEATQVPEPMSAGPLVGIVHLLSGGKSFMSTPPQHLHAHYLAKVRPPDG